MPDPRDEGLDEIGRSVDAPSALDLSGHVALVTGANHGIGAATARGKSPASHDDSA